MIDKATIINWALTDIGAGPMFSVDDDSELAAQIGNVWQKTFDKVFGLTDWSFAKVTARLRRLDTPLENGWPYAFDLPSDRISNPLAYLRCVQPQPVLIRNFTLQMGKLCACEPEAWAVYKVAVDPEFWEPSFRSAFVTALSAGLAVPVWQDEDMRDRMLSAAFGTPSMQGTGGEFGRLVAQDKASAPVGEESILANDPLSAARPLSGGYVPWHGSF